MMRRALPVLLVLFMAAEVEGQLFRRFRPRRPIRTHHCGWALCDMCNRMFGFLPGDEPRPLGAIDSTPHDAVAVMIRALNLTRKDLMYDLGCGDARALIEAVRASGCRASGVEIDPRVAAIAQQNVRRSGFGSRIRVTNADANRYNQYGCTALFVYLHPPMIAEILPKLKPGTRIVSYMHPLPGIQTKIIRASNGAPIYCSIVNSWEW